MVVEDADASGDVGRGVNVEEVAGVPALDASPATPVHATRATAVRIPTTTRASVT
jgi:hypothetical protein